jgi:hypothetical protein
VAPRGVLMAAVAHGGPLLVGARVTLTIHEDGTLVAAAAS